MSLATSVNGTNLTCRPVQRMSADEGQTDSARTSLWSVHDPSEKSVSRNFVFYAADLTRT
jgi:hypothetical protein